MNRIGNIEEIVAATLVKMSGDVEGLMLFLFNMEFANTLLEKLLGKRFSSFEELDDLAYSALEEVGNIAIDVYKRQGLGREPSSLIEYGVMLASELLFGFVLGFGIELCVLVVRFASSVMDYMMGLNICLLYTSKKI